MANKYFIADLGDLPELFRDGNNSPLIFRDSKVKFSVCGCEESDYDTYIAPLKGLMLERKEVNGIVIVMLIIPHQQKLR